MTAKEKRELLEKELDKKYGEFWVYQDVSAEDLDRLFSADDAVEREAQA